MDDTPLIAGSRHQEKMGHRGTAKILSARSYRQSCSPSFFLSSLFFISSPLLLRHQEGDNYIRLVGSNWWSPWFSFLAPSKQVLYYKRYRSSFNYLVYDYRIRCWPILQPCCSLGRYPLPPFRSLHRCLLGGHLPCLSNCGLCNDSMEYDSR